MTLAFASRRVRTSVVRLPPTCHGDGDNGFMAALVATARTTGVAGFLDDGSSRWPATHRLDAARVFRLALEAPAGSTLHAVAEEGLPTREIAEAIARRLDLPTISVEPDKAMEHFGWLGGFFSWDVPASGAKTQDLFGWTPTHATLLEDLDAGHYTS